MIESKGWQSSDQPAALHAYEAANVAHELYNTNQNPSRDSAGMTLRFSIPTVINGRVYVGVKGGIEVYGLLSPNTHKQPRPRKAASSRSR